MISKNPKTEKATQEAGPKTSQESCPPPWVAFCVFGGYVDWFKHMTASHDDPDISDAWDKFGPIGPLVFWVILEIYGREFNRLDKSGELTLSWKYFQNKTRTKRKTTENILAFYLKRNRIISETSQECVKIKIPKFLELASNWVRREHGKPTEVPTEEPIESPTAIEEEVRNKNKKKKKEYVEGEAPYDLSCLLFQWIRENKPDFLEPNLQAWSKDMERLLRIDKRDQKKVAEVIIWCQQDDFWHSNILSPSKLRKQFDKLELHMKRDRRKDQGYGIYKNGERVL